MRREFVILSEFEKHWKDIGMTDEDLRELEIFLCVHPQAGDMMEETGGLRKLRWALKGRGKSGSIRTLYVDFAYYEKIYLITAYTKGEKENLSKVEKKAVKAVIKSIEQELERKKKNE